MDVLDPLNPVWGWALAGTGDINWHQGIKIQCTDYVLRIQTHTFFPLTRLDCAANPNWGRNLTQKYGEVFWFQPALL